MTGIRRIGLFLASAAVTGALLIACAGCTTAPLGTSGLSQPAVTITLQEYNNRSATVVQGVTAVRKASTALFRAGKITAEQDVNTQKSLDVIRDTLDQGRAILGLDPKGAAAKLATAESFVRTAKSDAGVQQ